jgi:hypothetical protein
MLKQDKKLLSVVKEEDKIISSLRNDFSNINVDDHYNKIVFKIHIVNDYKENIYIKQNNNVEYSNLNGILVKIYDHFYIITLAHALYNNKECYIELEENKIMGKIEIISFNLEISLIKLDDQKKKLNNYVNNLNILKLDRDQSYEKLLEKIKIYFGIIFPKVNDSVYLYRNNKFIESKISIILHDWRWNNLPYFAIDDTFNSKQGDCGSILLNKEKTSILGLLFVNFKEKKKTVVGFIPSIFIYRILREYLYYQCYNGLCTLIMDYNTIYDKQNKKIRCVVKDTFKFNYNVQTNLNLQKKVIINSNYIKNNDVILSIDDKNITEINDEIYIMFDEIGIDVTLDAYFSLKYFVNESISLEIDRKQSNISSIKNIRINCRPINSIINALYHQEELKYININNFIFIKLTITYLHGLVNDKIYNNFHELFYIFLDYKHRNLKRFSGKIETKNYCNYNIILLADNFNKSRRIKENSSDFFELYKINDFEINKKNNCLLDNIRSIETIRNIELINIKTDNHQKIEF